MKYRSFGKLNWKVSALGFGAMRLPIIGDAASKIDEPLAIDMIRYSIDHGVNYVDTAYVYHRGNSETIVGKALRNGYREKVKLATKMPVWLINARQDMDKYLDEQLEKLGTEIDFYLLHGLDKERWEKLSELNVTQWAEKKIDEGKIKHLGFSFHDSYDVFKEIVDGYKDWTFCQIQYNYVDTMYQAGTKGLRYAASKGLAVIVMEPMAGGRLAFAPPQPIREIWDTARVNRTRAELALLWVLNQPEVSVALSGMSTMQQVVEDVETANRSGSDILTSEELELVNRIAAKYKELGFIGCTGCRYCLPCPQGVDIPEIISLYNEYFVKNEAQEVKTKYWEHITPESQAKRCERCKKCEGLCPQHLPIGEIMGNAAWTFEQEFQKPAT
jgi:uncharacterized protein